MIRNYLITAWRSLQRNKTASTARAVTSTA